MNENELYKLVCMFILFHIIYIGYASAQEEYRDDFNIEPLDSSSLASLKSDTWQIIAGTASNTGSRPGF